MSQDPDTYGTTTTPTDRPRASMRPGAYLVRLHVDGATASIALLDKPDEIVWVGAWAAAATVLQDVRTRIDRPEPLVWEIHIS